MKKILFFAATIACLAGCSSFEDEFAHADAGYGKIVLDFGADDGVTVTRANVSDADKANWQVQIVQGANTKVDWKAFSEYTESDWNVPFGSYTVNVRNHDGNSFGMTAGKAIYEGANDVTVSGATNNVTVSCGKQKTSQVKVTFDETFTNTFTAYVMAVTDANVSGRLFTADASSNPDPLAYYMPAGNSKAAITYELKGTLNGQTGTKVLAKTTTPIEIDPAYKLNLLVKASSENGQIILSITYDDSVTEATENVIIDPLQWDTFTTN